MIGKANLRVITARIASFVLVALALMLFGCGSQNAPAQHAFSQQASSQQASSELLALQASDSLAGFENAVVERVVDGDTIWVISDEGRFKVRLDGIDAPESVHSDSTRNTPEGVVSSDYLKSFLPEGTVVWLQKDAETQDKYGSELRYVWISLPRDPFDEGEVADKMVNAILVKQGFARAVRYEPNVLYSDVLSKLEAMSPTI